VRLSVADVRATGPFSSFPGLERWFAVLEGDGVVLNVDGAEHRITRNDGPFRFDGVASVHCALMGGPTRDFNLMAAVGQARMQQVEGELCVEPGGPALLALYSHTAPARISWAGEELVVPAGHLAWCAVASHDALLVRARDALWMESRL
jgi:environmental stress-induced protein Ves